MNQAVLDLCCEQIERERAFLAELRDTAQQVRDALARGSAGIATALSLQEASVRRAAAAAQQRQVWRADVARQLRVAPEKVCLSQLAEMYTGADRQALLAARASLQRDTEQTAASHHRCAILLRTYLQALEQFFLDLTGSAAGPGCYGPAAARPATACGAIVHTQG